MIWDLNKVIIIIIIIIIICRLFQGLYSAPVILKQTVSWKPLHVKSACKSW